MPVVKRWWKADTLLNKRVNCGLIEYLVKFSNYGKAEWQPFFNITSDLILNYEERVHTKQIKDRNDRYFRRCMKKEWDLPVFEEVPIRGRHPKAKWLVCYETRIVKPFQAGR